MKSYTTDRHANARDRKRVNSRKMVVTNRGIFTIQAVIGKKATAAAKSLCSVCGRLMQPNQAHRHDPNERRLAS